MDLLACCVSRIAQLSICAAKELTRRRVDKLITAALARIAAKTNSKHFKWLARICPRIGYDVLNYVVTQPDAQHKIDQIMYCIEFIKPSSHHLEHIFPRYGEITDELTGCIKMIAELIDPQIINMSSIIRNKSPSLFSYLHSRGFRHLFSVEDILECYKKPMWDIMITEVAVANIADDLSELYWHHAEIFCALNKSIQLTYQDISFDNAKCLINCMLKKNDVAAAIALGIPPKMCISSEMVEKFPADTQLYIVRECIVDDPWVLLAKIIDDPKQSDLTRELITYQKITYSYAHLSRICNMTAQNMKSHPHAIEFLEIVLDGYHPDIPTIEKFIAIAANVDNSYACERLLRDKPTLTQTWFDTVRKMSPEIRKLVKECIRN